jgi:hypothetical protein
MNKVQQAPLLKLHTNSVYMSRLKNYSFDKSIIGEGEQALTYSITNY